MINLFQLQFATNDASIGYLSQLFGNMNCVISLPGASCTPNVTIISTMFKYFNGIVLTIGVLMLVYITILGVLGTAHEGEFMGKKMNNIWIPIRAVLGIALLVPTGAGYCGIQILMMWFIVQGIGIADTLWDTAVVVVEKTGSPYSQISIPVVGARSALVGLFQGLACDASTKQGDPKGLGGYTCTSPGGCGGPPPFNADPTVDTYTLGGTNATCGSLSYCNQNTLCTGNDSDGHPNASSLACSECKAQIDALQTIIPTLAGVAQQLVAADYSYTDFTANSATAAQGTGNWQWVNNYCRSVGIQPAQCCFNGPTPSATCKAPFQNNPLPSVGAGNESANQATVQKVYLKFWPQLADMVQNVDFIRGALDTYQQAVNAGLTNYLTSLPPSVGGDILANAQTNGWIYAGALYMQIANKNTSQLSAAVPSLTWNLPSSNTNSNGIRYNISAAGYLASAAAGDTSTSTSSQVAPGASSTGSDAVNSITANFKANINNTAGVNPLLALQVTGTVLLITAQAIFFTAVALILALGISASINVLVLGTGVGDPLSDAAIMMTVFIVPFIWAVLGLLVTIGATLSIYTPLLPFIYFAFGALGWMVSTIEAMVAGPLVALGIISPSGQHEIMGKAEPAIGLLFNIFLRPSLMIFGLMFAMLLAMVACQMINATFKVVMDNGLTASNPISLILMLVAYVSLILAVLNKCFAVINLIPQQVMRWISMQGEGVEVPGEIKGAVESATGQAAGAVSGMGDKGKEAHQQKHQAEREKKEDKRNESVSPDK